MRNWIAILVLLCMQSLGFAQEESFSVSASKTTVSVDEQFQISFTLNTSGRNFQAPSFADFMVLSGPNQSQSMQFVNGSMSQSISYTYYLQPKSVGTFKIGSASISAGGKTLKTNPITITVAKSSNNSKQGGGTSQEESLEQQISKNVFIKPVISKTSVYRGEGFTVTYKLYTRMDLVSFNPVKMPTLEGFWSQDIEQVKEIKFHTEVLDGVKYNVADLKKTVLFPQRAGALVVDAMEGESVVRVRLQRKSRNQFDPFEDFFNDPFFGGNVQDYKYVVKSTPVKITVKPLPENAPASYSGAVGKFSVESFLDKTSTKANEPVTLKIKIIGKGNLKLIDPVQLNLPPDIETYEPKITDNISVNQEGVSGSRTFEYLLIPRRAGTYKINPLEFSYFSLDKKQYVPIQTPEFELQVSKGAADAVTSGAVAGVSKSDVELLGKDIRFIKTGDTALQDRGSYFYKSILFYILLLLPIGLFIGFLVVNKKSEQDAADVKGTKSRKATKVAKKKLAVAETFLKQKNYSKVYEELLKALWGYIADKYSIPVADLNKDSIRTVLTSKGKSNEAIEQFLKVITACEFARYAPAASEYQVEQVYKDSVEIITNLEQ